MVDFHHNSSNFFKKLKQIYQKTQRFSGSKLKKFAKTQFFGNSIHLLCRQNGQTKSLLYSSTYLLSGLDSLAWTLFDQLPPLSRDLVSSCLTKDVVMLTPRSVNSWSPKLTPSCFTQPKRSKLSPCQNKNTCCSLWCIQSSL